MEDADAQELSVWATRLVDALRKLLRCVTSPPTSKMAASRQTWSSIAIRRRGSAFLPQAIDDALYDAFGQRQVSTIFTQLNQYHVVLEVNPSFHKSRCAQEHLRSCQRWATGTARLLQPLRNLKHRASRESSGQFPVVTLSFNLAPGSRSEKRESD